MQLLTLERVLLPRSLRACFLRLVAVRGSTLSVPKKPSMSAGSRNDVSTFEYPGSFLGSGFGDRGLLLTLFGVDRSDPIPHSWRISGATTECFYPGKLRLTSWLQKKHLELYMSSGRTSVSINRAGRQPFSSPGSFPFNLCSSSCNYII